MQNFRDPQLYVLAACALLLLGGGVLAQGTDGDPSKQAHHYFAKTEHAHSAEWGYTGATGPKFWGGLDPSYVLASSGRRQSPINIDSRLSQTRKLPKLNVDYRLERISAFNNGHTIQHDESPGSFLRLGNERYALEQFHVHTPSEHTLDGKQFPMEIHFVHKSLEGQVVVVAVFVRSSHTGIMDMPTYHLLPESGKKVRYQGKFDPAKLLPRQRDYFEYSGSFTTPPCTEDVRWIVMRQPIDARAERIAVFEAILNHNNRPVQPLNRREILKSE